MFVCLSTVGCEETEWMCCLLVNARLRLCACMYVCESPQDNYVGDLQFLH